MGQSSSSRSDLDTVTWHVRTSHSHLTLAPLATQRENREVRIRVSVGVRVDASGTYLTQTRPIHESIPQ